MLDLQPDPKRNAYVLPIDLHRARHNALVVYSYGHSIRSLRLPGNVFWKDATPFGGDFDKPEFADFLAYCRQLGIELPSSYAKPFHAQFSSPRVKRTVNALYEPYFCGGWEEAIVRGSFSGTYFQYDLNSAYLWAASLGLPDISTLEYRDDVISNLSGCYVVDIEPSSSTPFPFSSCHTVIATDREIEVYGLNVRAVRGGYTWRNWVASDIPDLIRSMPCAKQIGRCYWGQWGASQRLSCESKRRTWTLPNMQQNYLWAHIITSRPKMRCWETARGKALHVFIDSLILPHEIESGVEPGGWRLVKRYNGIRIEAVGRYGPLSGPLDKHSGTVC
jgi:hypothetical protein